MSLGHALGRIVREYPLARLDPLPGHPLADVIRRGAADEVRAALPEAARGFLVKGSPGRGRHWAAVPWIAVFDPAVTTSATRGIYLVYLFPAHREAVHLSLAQGTVAAIRAHGPRAEAALRSGGARLRALVAGSDLPVTEITLGSEGGLPRGYEAAHIRGLTYGLADLADEARLRADLAAALGAYRSLTARVAGERPSSAGR
ncbi:DUF3578 domain-containing protein [Methylobacterium oryzisoli]|uniref:DUF3578 domain-containing protein n=1 Tax=Methylobacterium oryzisoli TaxID=3385502 RepID=UPI003891A93F